MVERLDHHDRHGWLISTLNGSIVEDAHCILYILHTYYTLPRGIKVKPRAMSLNYSGHDKSFEPLVGNESIGSRFHSPTTRAFAAVGHMYQNYKRC